MKNHPWLEKYEINSDSKYLILGTHPPMPYKGSLEFYYGNLKEFWRFLDLVYPGKNLYLNGKVNINDILYFLEHSLISISDIIYVTRVESFSTDKDMGKVYNEDLNPFLEEWLVNSKIEVIYFTSFGGTNSAKSLFKKCYKYTFKKTCKLSSKHESFIELSGRTIRIVDLFSPSPSCRRSLPKSKEFLEWSQNNNKSNDFDGFRLYWYKKHLPKIEI